MPVPAVRVKNIPQSLRELNSWVLWKYEERDGKITKPPFQPDGRHASHSDPDTWSKFDAVVAEYSRKGSGWDGIGFVLTLNDPFAGVDLDHVIDEAGEIDGWVLLLIERFASYSEITPSGTGVRIFGKGELPADAPKGGRKLNGQGPAGAGGIEVYDKLRYLTVTGRRIIGTPPEPQDFSEAFTAVYREFWGEAVPEPKADPRPAALPVGLNDQELLTQMFASKHGADAQALMGGDTSRHNDDDSAATLALCNHLAFWCGGDRDRMDRLFRSSGLMRPKWDAKRDDSTWGAGRIDKALAGRTEFYTGPSQAFGPEPDPAQTLADARAVVKALPELARKDASTVYTPSVLASLALVRQYDPGAWAQAKVELGRIRGFSLTDLRQALPAASLTQTDRRAYVEGVESGENLRLAGDMLDECPAPRMIVPDGYTLTENHTNRVTADEDGRPRIVSIALAPVLISGVLKDASTGSESLLLAWKDPGQPWASQVVDRQVAYTGRELQKLAGFFPIADDNAKELVKYLRQARAANALSVPQAAVTSHLGWQGTDLQDASFLVGHTLIQPGGDMDDAATLDVNRPETWSEKRICFHGSGGGEEQLADAFRASGEFVAWLEAIKVLQYYPKALLAFYASFCPPLLQVFNVPNFIVDLANRTSTGKTTVLRAAGSVWGNPDPDMGASVIGTWDVTRVWAERASHLLSGMPLLLDDSKQKRDPKAKADLIYSIVSGHGRGRGNLTGVAKTLNWRTVVLSTGEEPLTSCTQDGGTRARVLTLYGMPFGDTENATRDQVNLLKEGVRQHYGHAGPLFVQWFIREKRAWSDWKGYYRERTLELANLSEGAESGRIAQYAGLISVGAEMAHRGLGLPWEFDDPVTTLWPMLAAEVAEASGDVRALELVYSWAYSRQKTFYGRFSHDGFKDFIPVPVSGRWDAGEDWEFIGFYVSVLRNVLQDDGHNPDAILRSWKDRGWLNYDGKKNTRLTRLSDGDRAHLIQIRRSAFDVLSEPETQKSPE